jgi:hypothetical protein
MSSSTNDLEGSKSAPKIPDSRCRSISQAVSSFKVVPSPTAVLPASRHAALGIIIFTNPWTAPGKQRGAGAGIPVVHIARKNTRNSVAERQRLPSLRRRPERSPWQNEGSENRRQSTAGSRQLLWMRMAF